MHSGPSSTTLSRRTALRVGALTVAGLSATGLGSRRTRARGDDSEVTVATRNLGLGANLASLFFVRSPDELAETAGRLYRDVRDSAVERRMAAIAAELAAHEPDVVGVQEAALVRTDASAEATTLGKTNAENVAVDFLAELTAALAGEGVPYEVAQVTTNADAEFPAATEDGRLDVRLTDRDAVLVREGADATVESTSETAFDTALDIPVDGDVYRVKRGYGTVRATVRGRGVSVVNTHLESASERVRNAQATQLADALGSLDGPLVVLGDANDGPAFDGGAYETLAADFTDAWEAATPDDPGYTCCQRSTLENEDSRLDERVDLVLVRGGLTPTSAVRVGAAPSDRIDAGDGRTLWSSDHAGVVATLARTTESAESETAERRTTAADGNATTGPTNRTATTDSTGETADDRTREATSNESRPGTASDAETPGFGPVASLAGLFCGGAALARRARRDD
ncbi:Endonuclease/Exonuclease/phosphatase family protein [Halopelagius inordinatus]|uniref:Endonuclease/Exonuclease/phosphatase family protein n=1 Tax=Halopelagius inordinatus TaxID=553467 RepID=A0A1I2MAN6_9EURY|nr:endonuclease/exonuclease/phosphatase family protein [Halopelagius inordinatus]SFF88545.1 Endonuclease/Exonuclease/phosphatase family protein [Halopelagius inordinatus]